MLCYNVSTTLSFSLNPTSLIFNIDIHATKRKSERMQLVQFLNQSAPMHVVRPPSFSFSFQMTFKSPLNKQDQNRTDNCIILYFMKRRRSNLICLGILIIFAIFSCLLSCFEEFPHIKVENQYFQDVWGTTEPPPVKRYLFILY